MIDQFIHDMIQMNVSELLLTYWWVWLGVALAVTGLAMITLIGK